MDCYLTVEVQNARGDCIKHFRLLLSSSQSPNILGLRDYADARSDFHLEIAPSISV